MYNPTNPGYSTQNQTRLTPNYEPTLSDNPYASSPYETPPPPPKKRKRLGFLWLVVSVLLLSIIISASFVVGRLSEHQTNNVHRTAPPSTSAHTSPSPTAVQRTVTPENRSMSNQEYTAVTILQDFIMAGASPTVQDHNITIWNWTKELGNPYYISVHATSSVTFIDTSGCSGPCDGFLNGGIWVYSNYATTFRAYEDASTDQEHYMLTPPTGPEIIPTVYRHGRCLLLGPDNTSIYTRVVTQYCI